MSGPQGNPTEDKRTPTDWRLRKSRINNLQQASMEQLVRLAKQAHFVDVKVRINGEDRWFEVDWIKHLEKDATPLADAVETARGAPPIEPVRFSGDAACMCGHPLVEDHDND